MLASGPVSEAPPATPVPVQPAVRTSPALITEDDVKRAVRDLLTARGLHVEVKWGRDRGIDVVASGPAERWVVEAKGAVASDQQQGNYFLGALGELVQRMDDPHAQYALALPDNSRYRGLVNRLPRLARQRLGLVILFVDANRAVAVDRPGSDGAAISSLA